MTKDTSQIAGDFVQLARLALTGRPQDVQLLVHRAMKRYRSEFPTMAESLSALLRESPTRASPLRRQSDTPLPVDIDSRLHLLRVENDVTLDHEMILTPDVEASLQQVVIERHEPDALIKAGLQPTRTILFTGPPGVGKTMAAKWLARQLDRPLLTLDLAAVMSSFLGRTGSNLRHVLDYAKSIDCVLLLDELDALAKRRDDRSEVGELKRLVTVLLQEVDDWPATGILVAATNHAELLDPAVWRRFELAIQFDIPGEKQIEQFATSILTPHLPEVGMWAKIFSLASRGKSYNDIEREIMFARRSAAITGTSLSDQLKTVVRADKHLSRKDRIALARLLEQSGMTSQREAQRLTGVSRDTIRKGSAAGAAPRKKVHA
ncbi:MAG: AAA family ATPase [Alphaproteobacteria bacterium]|nr:ATP-binding protein [Alphaproteobacteria bacterium]MDE2111109.1 AAA family ATPase [Alphaproteobacteria bacterium]MDE2495927.1 AAA family ATPase [Alphaproteobacteria bacterium]